MAEYRIEELARLAGTTVRNIRAYQERRLLPSPRLDGRVGIYSDVHLARALAVRDLLDRGYRLAAIGDLLRASDEGARLSDLFGAVTDTWSDELPSYVDRDEATKELGELTEARLARMEQLDAVVCEPDGRLLVPRPQLYAMARQMVELGFGIDDLLDLLESVQRHLDALVVDVVDLVATTVIEPHLEDLGAVAAEIEGTIRTIRPLARTVVDVELGRSLERQARERLEEMFGSDPDGAAAGE